MHLVPDEYVVHCIFEGYPKNPLYAHYCKCYAIGAYTHNWPMRTVPGGGGIASFKLETGWQAVEEPTSNGSHLRQQPPHFLNLLIPEYSRKSNSKSGSPQAHGQTVP